MKCVELGKEGFVYKPSLPTHMPNKPSLPNPPTPAD